MSTYPRYIPEDTPLGKPNCGVISTAMICGITHDEAWEAIKENMPKGDGRTKNWNGGTYDHERFAVFKAFGVEFERLPRFFGTLRQWLQSDQYKRSQTYECCVTRHAMVLHRGRLFDQNAGKSGVLASQSPYLSRRMSTVCLIKSGSPLRDNLSTEEWV